MQNSIDLTDPKSIKEAQVQAMKNMLANKFKIKQIAEYTSFSKE